MIASNILLMKHRMLFAMKTRRTFLYSLACATACWFGSFGLSHQAVAADERLSIEVKCRVPGKFGVPTIEVYKRHKRKWKLIFSGTKSNGQMVQSFKVSYGTRIFVRAYLYSQKKHVKYGQKKHVKFSATCKPETVVVDATKRGKLRVWRAAGKTKCKR